MRVAAVQMPVKDGSLDVNIEKLSELIDLNPGADLYLLPELWSSGFVVDRWSELSAKETPEVLNWMSKFAAKNNIWLCGSVISKHDSGGICNRLVVFNRNGELVKYYDKIHRFLPMGEDVLVGGSETVRFKIEGIQVSLAICYDLRFPEMFRKSALSGVDLYLVSSAWPIVRQEAMTALAGARAIENQAYVLLSNRTGADAQGQVFCGCSGLYGPHGRVKVFDANELGVAIAEINMDELRAGREKFNVFGDRIRGVDYD
ncbi:MAG: nitrilase-related carbon-nitrogen hydrolase [Negativicutes bacterium]